MRVPRIFGVCIRIELRESQLQARVYMYTCVCVFSNENRVSWPGNRRTYGQWIVGDVMVTARYHNLLIVSYVDNCISFLSPDPSFARPPAIVTSVLQALARFRGA